MAEEEEDYFVPLEDQRVFGAGIKRKRIAFVPASGISDAATSLNNKNVGDKYLAIVFGKMDSSAQQADTPKVSLSEEQYVPCDAVCPVCRQLLSNGDPKTMATEHKTSIAHQFCLEHSHPPSHLDRNHVGLKYLSDYGWDPDSRRGLGAQEKGIRIPIKAKEKHDTSGLGHGIFDEDTLTMPEKKLKKKQPKTPMLNAKEIRKLERDKTRQAEQLRQSFYGEDLSKYLGPNG